MSILLNSLLTTFNKDKKKNYQSKSSPAHKKSSPKKKKSPQKPAKQSKKSKSPQNNQAQESAREIINFAREEADKIRAQAREEMQSLRESLKDLQSKLTSQQSELDRRQAGIAAREKALDGQRQEIEKLKEKSQETVKKQVEKLEKIASLTRDKAKGILLEAVDKKITKDIAERLQEAEDDIREKADDLAQEILVDAMYHGATDYVAEYTLSTVKIPDDDVKGRIIGKDGRNIKTFEKVTGVDIDMDETPGEVRLSCFNSTRREIARVALERLIKDGRIQPTRIEEYVVKARRDIERIMYDEGKKLCHAVGAYNIHRDLVTALGHFKYRSSYGQNMLAHTLEETKIGMKIAREVGANIDIVRMGCLFHDIGKVVEEEGSHVELGVKLLKKYKIDQRVIDTVAQHHEDEEYTSRESVIVYIADAISGSRPGARYENYDAYVDRLTSIEDIAKSKKGVKEAFAIQAGREVRVIVDPAKATDDEAIRMATEIRDEIKENVTYPGTVTVTVIRETRASQVAK